MAERDRTASTLGPLLKELARAPEVAVERPAAMAVGAQVDRYEILGLLGEGGMGAVYRARDTRLGRTVALKLLRENRSAALLERFSREARALAQLSHPNIVVIHDFGAHPDVVTGSDGLARDEIFIAMELVEGSTLREWLREPHDWRAIVDVFLAVGRGLGAAHALGLVHRDVKPSNVFLDRDGTPKIGDFGLVAWAGALEEERTEPGASSSPHERTLTSTGTVMGTPAYMAPEQLAGERADARADQFAFCVSLFEALTGGLPGETREGRPMPRKLEPIVARGMAPDPADRYPSIEALCAALARVRRGNARTWAALGGAGAAVAIAGVAWTLARSSGADVDPCPAPTAAIDPVWGGARRAAVRGHALAIDPQDGAARASLLEERLDPWTRAWSDMSVGACRATRVLGTQSDTMLDRRMTCLDRRLAELDYAIGLVQAAAKPAALDSAISGVVDLPPLADCADGDALARAAALPDDPRARAEAQAIAREIDRLSARRKASQLDGLVAKARAVVDRARALGHAPTLADALAEQAAIELIAEDFATGETVLRELTQVAASAHDDRGAAYAWTNLSGVMADLGKSDEARALVPAASAAVLRAGDPVDLRAELLFEEAVGTQSTPRIGEGITTLEQALALLEKAGARSPGSWLAPRYADYTLELGVLQQRHGDAALALSTFHRSIDSYQRLYGKDSAQEAYAWNDLANASRWAGKLDDAVAAFREAIRIREARVGDSPALAMSYGGLAEALNDGGRYDDALPAIRRAVDIDRRVSGEGSVAVDYDLEDEADRLSGLRRYDEALPIFDEIIPRLERSDGESINVALTIYDRADLEFRMNRCDRALPDYARAIELMERSSGTDYGQLVYPLVGQGRCLVGAGRASDAIAPLQRALSLHAPGGAASLLARARFYLGRAQVESGRDRAGGLAAARAARAAIAGSDPRELAEIDRWLADHR
jgi:tetratricopeptide (TPR) repeat protein/tRNA A-37 threonylcarbamoyl transferase component Bud32